MSNEHETEPMKGSGEPKQQSGARKEYKKPKITKLVESKREEETPRHQDFGIDEPGPEILQGKAGESVDTMLLRALVGEQMMTRIQLGSKLDKILYQVTAQTTAINQLTTRLAGIGDQGEQTRIMKMIDAMEDSLGDSVKDFNDLLEQVNATIIIENSVLKENRDAMRAMLTQLEESQNLPPSLRMPTLDRMREELPDSLRKEYEKPAGVDKETGEKIHKVGDENWDVKNEIYQNMVEDWFEGHIRAMESSELAFEEQPDMYRYLSLYASNFAKTEGMMDFGERIQARLEARRIRHRAVRVLSLSPADAIVGVLDKFKVPEMSNFFRDEIVGTYFTDEKTGRRVKVKRKVKENGVEKEVEKDKVENHVEKELRNYERMMRILRGKRNEYRDMYLDEEERMKQRLGVKRLNYKQRDELGKNPELKRLSDEIKAKERYIVDYYTYGGHMDDKGIDDAYTDYVDEDGVVIKGKWNEKLGDESNDNEKGFFYRLGTLDSQDEMIGKYAVKDLVKSHIKEGTDEIPGSREKEKDLRDKLWARRYAGGTSSLMLRVSREAQLNGTADFYMNRIYNFGDKVAENYLLRHTRELWDPTEGEYKKLGNQGRLSLEYIDIMSDMLDKADISQLRRVGITKRDKDHTDLNGAYLSFENLDWGSSVLWDDLIQGELAVNPATPSVKGTYAGEVDGSCRKPMWGPDSLLHGPTVEKTGAIEHMGGHLGTGAAKPFSLPGSDKLIEVSKQEKFQIGMMDRSLNNLRSDEAKDQLGDPIIGYAEKATMCEWINSWVRHGMIDGQVRDILFEKYLGTTSKTKLRIIATVDVILSDWKNNWGTMTMQGFGEFLKRLLAYILADEGIKV